MLMVLKYPAYGQETRNISGVVTTFRNIPLNKARISALKSGATAITDSTGRFTIECFNKDVLYVAASGFRERKIKIKKDNIYKIDLPFNEAQSDFEKAVNGGHIAEDILKKAIASSSPIARDYSKYKSIYELISSEIYNVRVKGNEVYNTRVKSFDQNPKVLYVVDDKIVTDISYINPDYVKSIEFVDDASTSIFGVMGANGVLKIYLK